MQMQYAHERKERHLKNIAEEDQKELQMIASEIKKEQDKHDARRKDAYEVRRCWGQGAGEKRVGSLSQLCGVWSAGRKRVEHGIAWRLG